LPGPEDDEQAMPLQALGGIQASSALQLSRIGPDIEKEGQPLRRRNRNSVDAAESSLHSHPTTVEWINTDVDVELTDKFSVW